MMKTKTKLKLKKYIKTKITLHVTTSEIEIKLFQRVKEF